PLPRRLPLVERTLDVDDDQGREMAGHGAASDLLGQVCEVTACARNAEFPSFRDGAKSLRMRIGKAVALGQHGEDCVLAGAERPGLRNRGAAATNGRVSWWLRSMAALLRITV